MTELRKSNRAADLAERLDDHPLALGLLVLAFLVAATYVSIIAINGVPFAKTHRIRAVIPVSAPLLKDGDDVRIAGQRVGQVRKVDPGRDGALVSMDIDRGPVGRGATATVRLRGLAGATYVEINRGDVSHPLKDQTITLAHSSSGVDLSAVVAGFDAPTRGALGRATAGYGAGLIGRGQHVNAAIADLPPTLRDLTPILDHFSPGPGQLSGLAHEAGDVAAAAAPPGSHELGGLVQGGATTLLTTATHSSDLAASLDALRPLEDQALTTLPETDPLLDRTTILAQRLTPAVEALHSALPPLNRALARRGALPSLTTIARRGRPVLTRATPLVGELRPVARSVKPLADPLLPLTAYVDKYPQDLYNAPNGFTRWGGFKYDQGQARGARAVRFAPVFTCGRARNPYPKPNTTIDQHSAPCLP